MWGINYRLIVLSNKNHKTPENIRYFKRRVNTACTYTPQQVQFQEQDIVVQRYEISCPKTAFISQVLIKRL